jgi:hypothetical protein
MPEDPGGGPAAVGRRGEHAGCRNKRARAGRSKIVAKQGQPWPWTRTGQRRAAVVPRIGNCGRLGALSTPCCSGSAELTEASGQSLRAMDKTVRHWKARDARWDWALLQRIGKWVEVGVSPGSRCLRGVGSEAGIRQLSRDTRLMCGVAGLAGVAGVCGVCQGHFRGHGCHEAGVPRAALKFESLASSAVIQARWTVPYLSPARRKPRSCASAPNRVIHHIRH